MSKNFRVQRCLRLASNDAGRDLVVGDLHGHRGLLEQALARLAFDPARDRVLSVGDLINRGPQSLETLSLLEEPWFHAVLGNHELMLLNYLGFYGSRVHARKSFAAGGGDWIHAAVARHPKTLARLAERVAALPLALHVEGRTPFNVMHGDLHPIGARQENLFSAEAICAHEADAATSSRAHFGRAVKAALLTLRFEQQTVRLSGSPFGELPVTYVGHSPIEQIVVHDSYVYIDQGVCAARSRHSAATLPTVLDHRRFSHWLRGVASARDRNRAVVPMTWAVCEQP